jgi:hypothetical protein
LFQSQRIAEEAKGVAQAQRRDDDEDAKVNKKLQKLTTALEEQAVRARANTLCSPVLSFAQEKTAKAEEEAALLEEQSQHYKDELDKALRQIEKLRANSQPVGNFSSPSFDNSNNNRRMPRPHVRAYSGALDQMRLRSSTPRTRGYPILPQRAAI